MEQQTVQMIVDTPWYYIFIPAIIGIVLSWALVWLVKFNSLLMGWRKPANWLMFYLGIVLSGGFGYVAYGEIIEYERGAWITSIAAAIFGQFLYMGIMAFMKGKEKWDRVYRVIKVENINHIAVEEDEEHDDSGMITRLSKTRFKK